MGLCEYLWRTRHPPQYDDAFRFRYGAACVIKDGRASLIDREGHTLLNTDYRELEMQAEGWITVKDAKTFRSGCLNHVGELVIPCKYKYIEFGDGELLMVYVGDLFKRGSAKFGFVNRSGEEVVPPIYNDARAFLGGYAEVSTDGWHYGGGKWGLIDEAGAAVIEPRYSRIDQLNGLVRFALEKEVVGVMDIAGNIILPAEYRDIFLFGDGTIGADNGDFCGLFRHDGSELMPFKYHYLYLRWDEPDRMGATIIVKKEDAREGYVDRYGNVKIPFRYDDVYKFNKGFAYVKRNHKFGVIDTEGKEITSCIYDDIWHIHGALTVAQQGGDTEYDIVILDNGQTVLPPLTKARCLPFTDDRAWLKYKDQWVVLGKPGT
jgi:hypothetical protein